MTVKTGSAWSGLFVCLDATGALAAGTPSGTLYVNGAADGASVTITGSNPYKFSVTLPTLTAGQRVDMYITATIDSISTAGIVASEQADTTILSDGVAVASIANNAITAAVIASDAIDADSIKADAITEIQNGLATASALATVAGYVDTEVAAIKAKTDNLPASPAASGEYTSALSAIQADLDNPNQYKADVSGLATSAHLQEVEDKVDGLSGLGIGSEVWQYTLLDNNGVPIADAYIEVTSDDAGIIKLDRGITNAGGVATFHLDPGTVYVWRYKYGYAGDNPDIETVP